MMKAITFERYGQPKEVLTMTQIPIPKPKDKEVLVKIHCTTVNDYEWSLVRGKPYLYRLMFGLRKPKRFKIGMELSGTVVELGPDATKFKIKEEVFGDTSDHGFGTFSEYTCIHEDALILKPHEISFADAVTLPHASCLAYQGLENLGKMSEGQKILINGAGGGVGAIAVQLAKLKNCEVTGVDSMEKFSDLKALGYDHVIDYKTENFTKSGIQYDLILDCKSNQSVRAYKRALKPDGIYVTIGGKLGSLAKVLMNAKLFSWLSSKKLKVLALKANEGLEEISKLMVDGKIKSQVDGPFPLSESPERIGYFGHGKHKGKVVIQID